MLTGQFPNGLHSFITSLLNRYYVLEINGMEYMLNIERPIGYGRAYSARSWKPTSE